MELLEIGVDFSNSPWFNRFRPKFGNGVIEMQEDNKRLYGYARVSSRGQCLDRQLDALKARGIPERDIYVDKASGKDFERPEYQRMKQQLQAGDTLVVLELDRLGRNFDELAVEWNRLTLITGVEIEVLNLPILNTAQDCNSLSGKFVANLVFNVLNYVAEQERYAPKTDYHSNNRPYWCRQD